MDEDDIHLFLFRKDEENVIDKVNVWRENQAKLSKDVSNMVDNPDQTKQYEVCENIQLNSIVHLEILHEIKRDYSQPGAKSQFKAKIYILNFSIGVLMTVKMI